MIKNRKILVIGSSNTDMTVLTETLPAPGETLLGGEFKMGGGGKGANQAVAAKRLGGDVQFICKVGHDIFGENAIASYKAEGLDTSLILRSEKPSGVALSEGKSLRETADFATKAASLTVQRRGAQDSLPYRHELE